MCHKILARAEAQVDRLVFLKFDLALQQVADGSISYLNGY
jgi:hypothetical protein